MEMSTGTSTKDKTIRQNPSKKEQLDFNAEFIRSMNTIHSHHDGNNSCDSSDSLNTVSDEIPVWVHGEQRWISGVNEDTTCADLVSVLLADEGIPQTHHQPKQTTTATATHNTTATTTTTTTTSADSIERRGFVITERWRRVEQILSDDTKILQIWSAWGHAKSEVKLTLRQIDPNSSTDWNNRTTSAGSCTNNNNDKDSGMGSPNGSSNSAIIRRRKHRASKATNAWVTQAQTLHPKSQKSNIEKLMKLILEQGETIQQQLAKLRDRELQITKIEEERHKNREKEHGKNYLLETYLNGLPEVEVKETVAAVNSDSGVQTEGATSSPEISCSLSNNQQDDDDDDDDGECRGEDGAEDGGDYILKSVISNESQKFNGFTGSYKEKPSHRERKLLKDHKQAKEFSSLLQRNENGAASRSSDGNPISEHRNDSTTIGSGSRTTETDVPAKIEWMEKVVAINKHLQREEELLVRLGAKIRKYESESSQLTEPEIREALTKVNSTIEAGNVEIKKIENDLDFSSEQLEQKANILEVLSNELLHNNSNSNSNPNTNDGGARVVAVDIPNGNSDDPIYPVNVTGIQGNTLNLNTDDLYSFSQFIAKPNYEFNTKNEYNNQLHPIHSSSNDHQKLAATQHQQNVQIAGDLSSPDQLLVLPNKTDKVSTHKMGNFALLNCYPPPPQGFEENYSDIMAVVVNHHQLQQQQHQQIANAPILNCKNLNPILKPTTGIVDRIPGFGANKNLVTSSPINYNLQKPINNNINNHPNFIMKQQQQLQSYTSTSNSNSVNMNIYTTTQNRMAGGASGSDSGSGGGGTNRVCSTGKLGPKRLINGICNEFESNSDTGLSSMGDDVLHLGTLV